VNYNEEFGQNVHFMNLLLSRERVFKFQSYLVNHRYTTLNRDWKRWHAPCILPVQLTHWLDTRRVSLEEHKKFLFYSSL